MPFAARIDEPSDGHISKSVCELKGWCSSDEVGRIKNLQFFIGALPVSHTTQSRPDVEHAFPECSVTGFLIRLDLSFYLAAVKNNGLAVRLVAPHEVPVVFRLRLSPELVTSCLPAVGGP